MREKSREKVGLDIGSRFIKMAEISESAGKASLISFGIKDISKFAKDDIAAAIKELSMQVKADPKEVVIAVSGPSVIARFISMPRMTAEELKGAVRYEAEKFIPFDINDCILDFQILSKEAKENKLEILLAAVKRGHVLEKLKLAEGAGLAVSAVGVDGFAVANSFFRNHPDAGADKVFALINIGGTITNVSIVSGGVPCFVRDVATGANDFAAFMSKGSGEAASPLDEIRLSFSYYENQYARNVDELYLSGGGAKTEGLEGLFQGAFGSIPKAWDPFGFLDKGQASQDLTALEPIKGSFAVAVGLAL